MNKIKVEVRLSNSAIPLNIQERIRKLLLELINEEKVISYRMYRE